MWYKNCGILDVAADSEIFAYYKTLQYDDLP
jgi:hypothetical protein